MYTSRWGDFSDLEGASEGKVAREREKQKHRIAYACKGAHEGDPCGPKGQPDRGKQDASVFFPTTKAQAKEKSHESAKSGNTE